jgi:hypothetical protein
MYYVRIVDPLVKCLFTNACYAQHWTQDGEDENGTGNEKASLHTAADEGIVDVVKLLLEREVDIFS